MTLRNNQSSSAGPARWAISLIAIAATGPYLALKAHWLSGGRIGLNDPEFGTGTIMLALNAVTAAMEIVAVVLALAFVTAWGRRLPSLLVVAPMWVATGLLGQILITLPIQLAIGATSEPGVDEHLPEPPIESWVFAVVYAGFAILGIFLIAGFALYARDRWSAEQKWAARLSEGRRAGPIEFAAFVLPIALAVASSVHLMTADRTDVGRLIGEIIVFTIAAAAAMALALGRPQSLRRWVVIASAFFSSGALASWGCYLLVVLLVPNDLTAGTSVTAGTIAMAALKALAGFCCAAVLARMLHPVSSGKSYGADHTSSGVQSSRLTATN
ncbi:hypothetical protein [Hoyosella subflava]|uniref:Uncharacterized protein n=1 Tax=Hoyosella subflava (strain DSM 45089 / JCM 17490 / NBRC 109087 / DQS3-9A1) TaxID=443218 RepID=F6EMV3_HOYSD|nr:hypothetical protein [Hoyosella subflava]AEF42845.1 hypothetical protein AS9A_4412 [Hoyosella subflava DQS3-9A1]